MSLGISRNEISKLLKTSRNTIRKVENTAKSLNLTWNDASTMSNEEFANKLFPKSNDDNDNLQPKPDCEMMYLELQKTGVNRMLLWEEYSKEVKAIGKIPLQYSQFCNYFNQYMEKQSIDALADAILDRVVSKSQTIKIMDDKSMRSR